MRFRDSRGGIMKNSKMLIAYRKLLEKRPLPFLACLSVLLELIIELLGHRPVWSAFEYVVRRPGMFFVNTAIIFITLVFVTVVRRKVFYSICAASLWLICGIVNCSVLAFREIPFSARDFSILASGILIADVYLSPFAIIGIIAGLILFLSFLVLLFLRAPISEKSEHRKKDLFTAAGLTVILFTLCFFGTWNVKPAEQYESVNEAYEMCGFPYCFTSSIINSGIDRPENYSAHKVSQLQPDDVSAEKKPNIILIQLESFFDPALIRGVELSENPIPHFSELRDSCVSGYLRMPTLGAGTANAEFEVLSGMSLDYFGIGEYPYETLLRENTCASIAYDLKELGYRTHAIHNYGGSFYGRNEVYPNLGFDDFTSLEYMHGIELTEKGWPKDAVLTEYIMKALEQTKVPDFVFTVTVQCHGKYPEDLPVENIDFTENEVFEGDSTEQFRYFVQQLQGTDEFLGDLTDALKNYPEDTVVIAYGDHLPSLGLSEDDLVNGSLMQTQYFIWSNYGAGTDIEDMDLSAYQLTSRLYDVIGIQGGLITGFHQEYMGQAEYQDKLELLEYDLLYGDRVAHGGVNPYIRTEMQMGLDEISADETTADGETLTVTGSGFTEYSIIYVDDERIDDTVYLSPTALSVPLSSVELTPESRIEICQTGKDRIILSSVTAPPVQYK